MPLGEELVRALADIDVAEVRIAEVGAHEALAAIAGIDLPHPAEVGEVEPLVVVTPAVGPDQQARPRHVRRLAEEHQALRVGAELLAITEEGPAPLVSALGGE